MTEYTLRPSKAIDVVAPAATPIAKLDQYRARKRRIRTVPVREARRGNKPQPLSAYMVPAKYMPAQQPPTLIKRKPVGPSKIVRYSELQRPEVAPVDTTRVWQRLVRFTVPVAAVLASSRTALTDMPKSLNRHGRQAVHATLAAIPFRRHSSHSPIIYSLNEGVSVAPWRRTETWFLFMAGLFAIGLIVVMLLCNMLFATYFSAFKPSVGAAHKRPAASNSAETTAADGQPDSTPAISSSFYTPNFDPQFSSSPSLQGVSSYSPAAGRGSDNLDPQSVLAAEDPTNGGTAVPIPVVTTRGDPQMNPGLPTTIAIPGEDVTAGDKPVIGTSATDLTLN